MTATQLSVFNDCATYLGERKFSSTSESRDVVRTLNQIWSKEIDWCLENGYWNFAIRRQSISHSGSVTPAFGYANAFDKPSDWIRTFVVSDNDQLDPPLLRFRDEGGVFYADCDPLYIGFVSNDASYGGNLSLWPTSFQDFLALRLAFRACPRTTANENLLKALDDQLTKAKKKAMAVDSMNNPPQFMPPGTWVRSRGGTRSVRSLSSGMIFRS